MACSNLPTVGIRFPKHRVAKKILKKLNFPLAMPSANKSNAVSPVTSFDVAEEEFKKKIKLIINGGRSKIGIESTVINLVNKPTILRPGAISKKKKKEF